MRKFLLKTGLFFLLLFVVIIVPSFTIYLSLPVNLPINGLASTIDKHERLEKISGKKIIIVGGSGCGMGINSEMIDTTFKEYDVVNMGLFGQLGLRYMLNEVKNEIRKGDIVVIIPEYQHFYYQFYGDLGMMRVAKIYPKGFSYLDTWQQWMVVAENFGPHFSKQFFRNDENPETITATWNRRFVNEYGDFCGHLNQPDTIDVKTAPLFKSGAVLELDMDVLAALNNFGNYAKGKGAVAVFMYPSIPNITASANATVISNIQNAMNEQCILPILNTPASSNLSDEYFYDTVYHLNKQGRDLRTDFFIRDLTDWMTRSSLH